MPSRPVTRYCLSVATILYLLWLTPLQAHSEEYFSRTYVQGYIGAADFDEDSLTFTEPSDNDPDTISTSDLSTMPYLGVAGQFAFSPEQTHFGIDASLLFGWRSDDSSVAAGNGQARVEIDSDLWLLDLAMGIYAQTILGDRWRLYGAIGPMMLFGGYSDDTKEEDLTVTPYTERQDSHSDSAFGVGGYAKLGFEYALSGDSYMGITLRGIATNLEFDRVLDDDGLTGVQGFISFTRAY